MSEHDSQPFDDRFNVPRVEGDHIGNHEQQNPFFEDQPERVVPGYVLPEHMHHTEMPERGKAQPYLAPEAWENARVTVQAPAIEWSGVGLQWVAGPGLRLVDIGRAFSMPDALADMHSVDLRTILAHLDSAAKAITSELDVRNHGNGPRR